MYGNTEKRLVGETGYEVKHAIHIGNEEIVFAEDKNAENGMCWFVGDYTHNDILGEYADCQINDDYLDAMQEFTSRVNRQIEAAREEIKQSGPTHEIFTAEHCYPNDYGQSIKGKIVAIKADVLRGEYRSGQFQLVLADSGFGANANARGRAVYCYHLNNGERTRFERSDIQGVIKDAYIPAWAKEKASEILAEKAKKPKDREER